MKNEEAKKLLPGSLLFQLKEIGKAEEGKDKIEKLLKKQLDLGMGLELSTFAETLKAFGIVENVEMDKLVDSILSIPQQRAHLFKHVVQMQCEAFNWELNFSRFVKSVQECFEECNIKC